MKKTKLLTALLLAGTLFHTNMAPAAEQTGNAVEQVAPVTVKININQADEAQLMNI